MYTCTYEYISAIHSRSLEGESLKYILVHMSISLLYTYVASKEPPAPSPKHSPLARPCPSLAFSWPLALPLAAKPRPRHSWSK